MRHFEELLQELLQRIVLMGTIAESMIQIAVTGLVSRTGADTRSMCGFALHLDGAQDTVAQVAAVDGVDFLARTIGRCDALGTIIADGGSGVRAALSELSGIAGVRRVESWWHLELVKERYSSTED